MRGQLEDQRLSREHLASQLRDMERHIDVTASEKRQEKVGFEGLNQRVTDLNAFVKELRGENKELQG